jgi:hypothetical protein
LFRAAGGFVRLLNKDVFNFRPGIIYENITDTGHIGPGYRVTGFFEILDFSDLSEL